MKTQRASAGFTLIELLVVIVIIAILIAIAFPMMQGAMMRGKMTSVLNNGRSLAMVLLSASSDRSLYPASTGSDGFANSTDYWKYLVTHQYLDVTFDFFSAPGRASYKGLDPSQFTPDQNAWCVVADVGDSTRAMTPILFTRNLKIAHLSDPVAGALSEEAPFGSQGVIVVAKDASATIKKQADLAESFNPTAATNVVLRP